MDIFNRKKIKKLEARIKSNEDFIKDLKDNIVYLSNRVNKLEDFVPPCLEERITYEVPEDTTLWHILEDLNAIKEYLQVKEEVYYKDDEYWKLTHSTKVPKIKKIKLVRKAQNDN